MSRNQWKKKWSDGWINSNNYNYHYCFIIKIIIIKIVVDFAVPADLIESEKRDKYQDLARELKIKLWNGVTNWCTWKNLWRIDKGTRRIKNQRTNMAIQTTVLSRSARILRKVQRGEYWEESWKLEETCCHSNSSEKPSVNVDVKNLSDEENDNTNIRI